MVTENRIPRDQKERELIIEDKGNCIVLASAGSGKTTILVEKLIKEAKKETQHFNYVAITFTNKAAMEVKDRLSKKALTNGHASTIDGFIESEIIKKFIEVKYPTIKNYVQSYEDNHKLDSYIALVNLLLEENILGNYTNNMQQQGKNFKFEFALNLLAEFKVIQEYIQFKYKMIFIDEYQDCDESMNNLFKYFKDYLGIRLFIVGDIKQSIYQWRGASPRYLEELKENREFNTYSLTENFRSKPSIVDFSLAISKGVIVEELADEKNIYYYNPTDDLSHKDIIEMLIEKDYINLNNENIILGGSNKEIENLHNQLSERLQKKFTYVKRNLISNCQNKILLEGIAKYYFNREYSQYDFVEDLDIDYTSQNMKRLSKKLEAILESISEENVRDIFNFLGVSVLTFNNLKETEILIEVLSDKLNSIIYGPERKRSMIMTTHASKGLEADTVLIFTEYVFGKYNKVLDQEKNYVGITRAENKLILIDDGSGMYKDTIDRLIHRNNSNKFNFDDFINVIL